MTDSHLALVKADIVSVYQAGAFFGSLSAYTSAFFLGRKRSLIFYSMVFILGAGLMLGANHNRGLALIYAGRVLAGLGVGGASMVVPIYISEIAPPAVRGRLVGIYEMGWQIGGLVGFWVCIKVKQLQEIELTSLLDQLWPQREHEAKPRTMAYSICCAAYPRWSSIYGCLLDTRVAEVAHVETSPRTSNREFMLDPTSFIGRNLHC